MQSVAGCCRVLQCVAVCCICVAVPCHQCNTTARGGLVQKICPSKQYCLRLVSASCGHIQSTHTHTHTHVCIYVLQNLVDKSTKLAHAYMYVVYSVRVCAHVCSVCTLKIRTRFCACTWVHMFIYK